MNPAKWYIPILLIALALLVNGCQAGGRAAQTGAPKAPTAQPSARNTSSAPTATFTAVPTATATPEPLALRVNGQGITQAEYQAEVGQLQEALQTLNKTRTSEQIRQQVLDNLTDTQLLAQAAEAGGFAMDDAAVQSASDAFAQQMGGADALNQWISQRGYDPATFQAALRRSAAAAWQRDQITASVPATAEQVHARQILTIDENIANRAANLIKIPGTNFAAYAYQYDPQTGGDLGWFPRGYLTQPEVEAAAFQLQPGEISPVIKSAVGYHILQVIARDPARPLSPDALRVLQHKALEDALQSLRKSAKIEILLGGN